ncbi:MAG: putative endonuclease [Patescibacteria group bacterium]|nr:putative endonuclease [Patescibacteria group bacterium]
MVGQLKVMFTVYVLKSVKDGNLYIGCTANLENRLRYHNAGHVKSTKSRIPMKLVYFEYYNDKYLAYAKEKFYKTAKGKKELRDKF